MVTNYGVLLLDVDGVLSNFCKGLLEAIGSDKTEEDITEWNLFAVIEPELVQTAKDVMNNSDFWLGLDPYPEAISSFSHYRDNSEEIYFVTSPWVTCYGWEHARRAWLKYHFSADASSIIFTRAKHLLRGDTLIDDNYEYALEYLTDNPLSDVYLYTRPYNEGRVLPKRMKRLQW